MPDLFQHKNTHRGNKAEAYYEYVDEASQCLFQVVRYENKVFQQRRPNGNGGWIWNMHDVRTVLYRLPEVIVATDVYVVEGEKDVETARAFGLVATCNPGGAGKWKDQYSEVLRDKCITIIGDADDIGRKHARNIASSIFPLAKSIKIIEMPGAKDLSEWATRGGSREKLSKLIETAAYWCSAVTTLGYDSGTVNSGPISGQHVLDATKKFIRRFVSLTESQAVAVATWVVHTHVIDAFEATPYLAVTSAEKQSGKTRLLEVLETIVANPWLTGRVTAAVLTRKIDAEKPTLLLDESDAAFGGEKEYAEALRGILNTGHRRGGKTSCCAGQGANLSYRDFSTFSPKAIAGIGKLPDTVADRSIPIRLKRAAAGEVVERFRLRDINDEAAILLGQIRAWCATIAAALPQARPELPNSLTDRQQDGVEPLLAIADAAGGNWPRATRLALVELCAEAQAADESVGKQLLADIQQIFEAQPSDKVPSAKLTQLLAEIETSPWSEWSQGKPLSPTRLARLLRPFGIYPHSIRVEDKTPKGYERSDFDDAFRRYLRPVGTRPSPSKADQGATPQQSSPSAV